SIILQGPEGNLKKSREIFTEPIDLSDLKENTKMSVGVEINSPYLRLAPDQPSHVTVNIGIEKRS
ncbi:MAG TPA: YbbR-like domain-containing protein, partial [Thermodesulfobacteriota bacterium]|nr:YbbR-like domain-containing protein [Thermodesulfobacteriota bacterium]